MPEINDINDLLKHSGNFDKDIELLKDKSKVIELNSSSDDRDDEDTNLSSNYKRAPLEVRLKRINGNDLKVVEGQEMDFLPILNMDGFVIRKWIHVLGAYPKTGKTTLLFSAMSTWKEEHILYFTEEAANTLAMTKNKFGGDWGHVEFVSALGSRVEEVMAVIDEGEETTVIIDTIKILGIRDENDNALITRLLSPLVSLCREKEQTLIFVHHNRKGGGDHGEALVGGHAFLGLVDIGLELKRDSQSKNRRTLRGEGRVIEIPEIIYEKEDNNLVSLGNPQELALNGVMDRSLSALGGTEWLKLKEINAKLSKPNPSDEQLRRALNELVRLEKAERDPKEDKRGATYRWRLYQPNLQRPLSKGGSKVEDEQMDLNVAKELLIKEFDTEKIPEGAPF